MPRADEECEGLQSDVDHVRKILIRVESPWHRYLLVMLMDAAADQLLSPSKSKTKLPKNQGEIQS